MIVSVPAAGHHRQIPGLIQVNVISKNRKSCQMKNLSALCVFLVSAFLEVGGDALVRKGLRSAGAGFIIAGFLALGSYGIVVNSVRWDFSKLLGVYIAVFAVVSTLFGRYVFHESIPNVRWVGIVMIVCGGLVIQFWGK